MIDVPPEHLETVKRILAEHVPDCEVRAFGSRVTGTAKDYSDLDLAIVCDDKLDPDTLRLLREAFEESDLPFRVDVVDWHAISPEFRAVVDTRYEPVAPNRSNDSSGWVGARSAIRAGRSAVRTPWRRRSRQPARTRRW